MPTVPTAARDLNARYAPSRKRAGLLVDGICGPETWGALVESSYRLGDRLLYLRRPMLRGDDVAELQRQLNALGFDAGREDGILGPETEAALRQFQRDAGLVTDAMCGPATVATLLATRIAVRRLGRARCANAKRCAATSAGSRTAAASWSPTPASRCSRPRSRRRLREHGAVVALDISGAEAAVVAAEANQFGADLVPRARHRRGTGCPLRVLRQQAVPLRGRVRGRDPTHRGPRVGPAGRRASPSGGRTSMLRETRMAAVVCELYSRDDPAGATPLTTLVPRARGRDRRQVCGSVSRPRSTSHPELGLGARSRLIVSRRRAVRLPSIMVR